ncbi:MAG: hypothetical protein ABR987_08065 [Terracidiphilus sp.]|jgi:hypothetical protein
MINAGAAFGLLILAMPLSALCAIGPQAVAHSLEASGITYYVDSSLPDINPASGTPDCTVYNPASFECGGGNALAFATIADLNAITFQPGDQILFRRGEIWRDQLTDSPGKGGYSGTANASIQIGSFGPSGQPLPIISGANLLSAWSSQNIPTSTGQMTVYSAPYTVLQGCGRDYLPCEYSVAPSQVFSDGALLQQSTGGASSLGLGQWYIDTVNALVWVRTPNDDSPSDHLIEASQRDFCVSIGNRAFISISDIQVEKAALDGIYAGWDAGALEPFNTIDDSAAASPSSPSSASGTRGGAASWAVSRPGRWLYWADRVSALPIPG